jgi:threonine/homoserine/homoserine lactone efflux protein
VTDIAAFGLAVLVFLMIPGPGTFAVLASSAKGGLRGGYACLAGLMLGDWLLMIAAMIGVAALLMAHPLVFRGVQYLGVAYLLWVGGQLLLTRNGGNSTLLPIAPGTYFRQGFLITVINPKAIVFYMAFFPLFIDQPTYQGPVTLITMGAIVSLLTLLYGSLLVLGGHWVARQLQGNRAVARWMSRLTGMALIGFGARLVSE